VPVISGYGTQRPAVPYLLEMAGDTGWDFLELLCNSKSQPTDLATIPFSQPRGLRIHVLAELVLLF